MVTHDKTSLCKACREIGKIQQRWFKAHCRECRSYCASWQLFLIASLYSSNEDIRASHRELTRKHNSLLRWLTQELIPLVEKSTKTPASTLSVKLLSHRSP